MQFNSYSFVLAFLPAIVLAYFVLGRFSTFLGKLIIIAGSLIFYAYSDISVLGIIGLSLLINYLFSELLVKYDRKKSLLFFPVAINILLLLYFKYTNFAIVNVNAWLGKGIPIRSLALPLGISFFTFQQIAYVVAVCRNEIEANNFVDYVAYILYFPKLIMGPLMDPVDFLGQFNNPKLKRIDWDNIAKGLQIFSLGLLKKVLLADTFAKAVSWGFGNVDAATSMDWLIVMLSYSFEIYFDFSGYSDMAVGVSQMLNITLPINFDSPYKAISIRDFWKRWHISLTKFLTKYIYIPLGGSKKGIVFTCVNTMIVFLISGIWHGANWTFIAWGLFHGLLSIVDRFIEKSPIKLFEPARWLLTFFIVNILWLLFRAESIGQWYLILKKIASLSNTQITNALITSFSLPEARLFFKAIPVLGKLNSNIRGFVMNMFILVSSIICFFPENNYKRKDKLSFISMILASIAFVWGITCLESESAFVYFNF